MKCWNRKRKPKHNRVTTYRLSLSGYYELYYYDKFKNDSYVLVDNGYVNGCLKWFKKYEERIEKGEVKDEDICNI